MNERARQLITALRLESHPEGGYYRRVFGSERTVVRTTDQAPRRALSTIYFLLVRGQNSRWHGVQADEVWYHLEGDPVSLHCLNAESGEVSRLELGPYTGVAEPVRAVPAGIWQAAELRGEYALIGCAVGPGFEFSDFAFAADHPGVAALIRARGAEFARLL